MLLHRLYNFPLSVSCPVRKVASYFSQVSWCCAGRQHSVVIVVDVRCCALVILLSCVLTSEHNACTLCRCWCLAVVGFCWRSLLEDSAVLFDKVFRFDWIVCCGYRVRRVAYKTVCTVEMKLKLKQFWNRFVSVSFCCADILTCALLTHLSLLTLNLLFTMTFDHMVTGGLSLILFELERTKYVLSPALHFWLWKNGFSSAAKNRRGGATFFAACGT